MTEKGHCRGTRTFEELSFSDQAKSLNAQLSTLTRAVRAHVRRANDEGRDHEKTRSKCVAQINRLRERIER